MLDLKNIDSTWTLFIDRDGVINYEKDNDYIHTWDEFKFYDAVLDAFKIFNKIFHKIIIITNQRGVGAGLTKEENLQLIHQNMQAAITSAGGRIDAIYYCTDLDRASLNRKPNIGMGKKAILDFPDINPAKSIMIGNTISDMEFGRNLGAYTVFLPTNRPDVKLDDKRIDAVFSTLYAFAKALPAGKL
jgi:D-glycero-D-manno-heptose 1,7-bisphosphate phosphatase